MIITLIVFTYLIVGFGVAMIYAFIQKRWHRWDHYEDPGFCIALILFYPIFIPAGIVFFIIYKLEEFFEWFSDCINDEEY